MPEPFDPAVLEAWREVLGPDAVLTGSALAPYHQNVTALKRDIPAALLPASTEQVQAVVEVANRFSTPLYPFSRGRNWGMGSRLPVRSGCVLVDLHRMDSITWEEREPLVAVIQPGVTQAQLYETLAARGAPVKLNVTGSSRDSSLLGNALERGIGYFSSRVNELCGLEVVLGNGTLLRTGFSHLPDCQTKYLYAPGVGPSLDGLFAQGNFGIVTRAGLQLMPAPECESAVLFRLKDEAHLGELVDACGALFRDKVLSSVLHLANRHRTEASLAPVILDYARAAGLLQEGDEAAAVAEYLRLEGYGGWSAICGMQGTRAMMKGAQRDIRRRLRGLGSVVFLDHAKLERMVRMAQRLRWLPAMQRKLAVVPSIREVFGLSRGIPTSEPMKSMYWPIREPVPAGEGLDPDASPRCGFIYFAPLLPLSGTDAAAAVTLIDQLFSAAGFVPYLTLNILNERVLEGVLNVSFDRTDPAQEAASRALMASVREAFRQRGWYPYRVGIDEMDEVVDEADPFWQTVRALKTVLDPQGIIAPGRYNLV